MLPECPSFVFLRYSAPVSKQRNFPQPRFVAAASWIGILVFPHADAPCKMLDSSCWPKSCAVFQPYQNRLAVLDSPFLLWIVGESVFFGWIGKFDRRDESGNAQQLQTPVDSTCFISAIQSKSVHRNAKVDLPFQMPQDQKVFLLVGRVYIDAC